MDTNLWRTVHCHFVMVHTKVTRENNDPIFLLLVGKPVLFLKDKVKGGMKHKAKYTLLLVESM